MPTGRQATNSMDTFRKKVIVAIVFWGLIVVLGAGYFFRQPISDFLKKFSWKPKIEEKVEVKVPTEFELQEQAGKIIESKDMNRCQEINDEMYKTVCVNNIALNLAQETQDISYCQKIDDKLVPISDCERQIILSKSIEREDINVCQETQNQELQKQCQDSFYVQLALKKEDIKICQQIQDKEGADFCYNNYLVTKNFPQDPQKFKCSLLKGVDTQADCKLIKEIKAGIASLGFSGAINRNECFQLKTPLFLPYCL